MGSLEVSPAADVLVYEVVDDESARTRAQLHYFLVDGTAAVFGGGGRAPTAFRLGAGPGDRAPLFAAGAGRRRLQTARQRRRFRVAIMPSPAEGCQLFNNFDGSVGKPG